MTTVRPQGPARAIVVTPRAAGTAAAPAARPVSPRVRPSAVAQMNAERPKFRNPEEYKNYVIKFTGYIKDAKANLQVAQDALAGEKQKLTAASAELKKPVDAAQKVYDDTHKLYNDPVEATSRQLSDARSALDHAIYPGKRKAAELDAEAGRLSSQIASMEGQIRDSRSRIVSLESLTAQALSQRSSAQSRRSEAESEIRRLEPQKPSSYELDSARNRVNTAAGELRAANDRVATTSSRVNRARELTGEISRLDSALSSYDSLKSQLESAKDSASGLKGWVTRRQNELASAKASGDPDRIVTAQSELQEAMEKYNTAASQVSRLESQLASLGSPDTIRSRLSSMRSELSGLSGAQSDYDRALSAKNSAQSAYDQAKQRLSGIEHIVDSLDSNYRKRDDAIRTHNTANANLASYASQTAQLNTTIHQLQGQLGTVTRRHTDTVAEANRQRNLQNPPTHPEVVSAKRRVDDLSGELNRLKGIYESKTAAPRAELARQQEIYNQKLAPFREKVADAERHVAAKQQEVDTVKAEFEKLKNGVGGFKAFWWKLRHHFDVKEFWKEQGSAIALGFQQAAGPGRTARA